MRVKVCGVSFSDLTHYMNSMLSISLIVLLRELFLSSFIYHLYQEMLEIECSTINNYDRTIGICLFAAYELLDKLVCHLISSSGGYSQRQLHVGLLSIPLLKGIFIFIFLMTKWSQFSNHYGVIESGCISHFCCCISIN